VISKFKALQQSMGFLPAFFYVLNRLLSDCSPQMGLFIYYFYKQPLVAKKAPVGKMQPRKVYDFFWLEQADPILSALPRNAAAIASRFDQGAECLVAINGKLRDREFLGCGWFAYRRFQEDEVYCVYDFSSNQEAVWDFDIYVVPEQRMSRLFLRLWQRAESQLLEKGYQYSLSRISAYNPQSIRSHERFGAQRIGWAVFLKLFKLQIMLSGKKPYLSLSWGHAGQPVLLFDQ